MSIPFDRERLSDRNLQRPRKFSDGEQLRMKNEQGILQYDVTVVSANYDKGKHKWMYTLIDYKKEPISVPVEETKLV